jgi:hypothetical protein
VEEVETRQEKRERKLKAKGSRMAKHGRSFVNAFKNATLKRKAKQT